MYNTYLCIFGKYWPSKHTKINSFPFWMGFATDNSHVPVIATSKLYLKLFCCICWQCFHYLGIDTPCYNIPHTTTLLSFIPPAGTNTTGTTTTLQAGLSLCYHGYSAVFNWRTCTAIVLAEKNRPVCSY